MKTSCEASGELRERRAYPKRRCRGVSTDGMTWHVGRPPEQLGEQTMRVAPPPLRPQPRKAQDLTWMMAASSAMGVCLSRRVVIEAKRDQLSLDTAPVSRLR